jgi:hypothetical protein
MDAFYGTNARHLVGDRMFASYWRFADDARIISRRFCITDIYNSIGGEVGA